MPDNEEKRSQGASSRIAAKLLMPLVATTVSAAASYAVKRAPQLLEEKVLPKLREAREADVGLADVSAKARSAAGGAGDLAAGLTARVKSVAGTDSDEDGASVSRPRSSASTQERERRRRERAAGRESRRKQSRS